jgi:hypothetical protein
MGSVGNKQIWSVKRRDFLKATATFAGVAGLAPALSAPFVSRYWLKPGRKRGMADISTCRRTRPGPPSYTI